MKILIIHFNKPIHEASSIGRLHFLFSYYIMDEERKIIEPKKIYKTIMTIDLANDWGYYHTNQEKFSDLQKILLIHYIEDDIRKKLNNDTLLDYEELKFYDPHNGTDCPLDPDKLKDVLNYEFEVEIYYKIVLGKD